MGHLGLPKLRWLLAGAVAAGIWVVEHDSRTPRPPERVPGSMPSFTLPNMAMTPPPRPSAFVTGSIGRPTRVMKTTTRLRMRAQASEDASIVATLDSGSPVKELVRAGAWRLVSAGGRKGWVRSDYLAAAAAPRPQAPVPGKPAGQAVRKP